MDDEKSGTRLNKEYRLRRYSKLIPTRITTTHCISPQNLMICNDIDSDSDTQVVDNNTSDIWLADKLTFNFRLKISIRDNNFIDWWNSLKPILLTKSMTLDFFVSSRFNLIYLRKLGKWKKKNQRLIIFHSGVFLFKCHNIIFHSFKFLSMIERYTKLPWRKEKKHSSSWFYLCDFRNHSMTRVDKTEAYLSTLPLAHQNMMLKYRDHLFRIRSCIGKKKSHFECDSQINIYFISIDLCHSGENSIMESSYWLLQLKMVHWNIIFISFMSTCFRWKFPNHSKIGGRCGQFIWECKSINGSESIAQ